MAVEVVIPMLGITIEKGKIIKWLKAEGEFVKKGEPIFEVETEKLVTEVESPGTGILKKILVPVDIEVPVLTVVAIITEKGEELPEKYREVRPEIPSLFGTRDSKQLRRHPLPATSIGKHEGFDIAILGAGPGGYVAAIRAAQMGARVLLIEKDELGGTCLNRGCIPTKSFLSDIKTYKAIKSSDLFLKGSKVSIDLKKMVLRKNRVVETAKKGISLLLEGQKITVIKGVGSFSNNKKIQVSSHGKSQIYEVQNIIIATGSQVASLPGIQIDGKRILSSDDVVSLKNIPKDILIIGGGVIGIEFATIFNWLGTKVTILEMLPQIVSSEDEEVIRGLKILLEKQGIKILTNAKVLKAFPKKVKMEIIMDIEGKDERLSGEKILMAVGRVPFTDGLNLNKIGIQMEGKFIKVNSRMETNIEHVYAIGDAIGKMMLAHAASAEGIVAVENILGKVREIDYQKIPNCIYTFPEVASVGMKEAEAKKRGYDILIGRFSYLNSGKALAIGESEGFVKIIAEKELGQILGVHILGEHATDLIGECLLAMNLEASVEDLWGIVKGHPTLSEIISEAARDCYRLAIHQHSKKS
jgi:dihydrolipoamide dehydrogenase